MSNTYVTNAEFNAYKSDLDERFSNVTTQLELLSRRITEALESKTIADFPTEEAQTREKVMTAFSDEIAVLVARLRTIEQNIIDLQALNTVTGITSFIEDPTSGSATLYMLGSKLKIWDGSNSYEVVTS